MKFLKKIVLTTILLFIFFPVNAKDNIAYLDMSLMMSKSLAGQSIQNQLDKNHKKNIEDFSKKEKIFKKNKQKILKKKMFCLKKIMKMKFLN